MRTQEFVVTVAAQCEGWGAAHEEQVFRAFQHVHPGTSVAAGGVALSFRVQASDATKACAYIERRLGDVAALRGWRTFRVHECSATPLRATLKETDAFSE